MCLLRTNLFTRLKEGATHYPRTPSSVSVYVNEEAHSVMLTLKTYRGAKEWGGGGEREETG